LGHLPHLHTLSASFNQLASLTAVDGPGPDDLPESLQCLSVPHNKLSQLPPDLPSWLPALQELDCSYNQ
jgi:Leucine-rich repeat (LRR) protein